MKAEPRRTPPLSVKLEAALNQLEAAMRKLGMIPVECTVPEWQFDHDPALGLRAVDDNGTHRPHQHDVRFLVWRPRVEHAAGQAGELDRRLAGPGRERIQQRPQPGAGANPI